jgi:outer membrane protein assembly factor BamB/tetratricopeptide (TPR) repeat protein
MAGKSFKGNLEVLNLSDIFQSLAMNRHSGTLMVDDGKREKKIFFAEGEICLLTSGRRMRLGDLLVAEGKITTEDLELALKLQKQSRKRLGEILVEEGFCEESDVEAIVRMQVEEELYDLFLWRKAEFEFLADQMPDDMAAESPNLTRLNINTNSLIMEALRRLDEWTLIQDAVPSTKEVFELVDAGALAEADVPEVVRNTSDSIDGKTTVLGLSEKWFMSEFETCQHLATLVKLSVVQALSQEALADKAEASYALNDFGAAAALYGRLAEYHVDQPKILIPLADSLRRTGVEKQALTIYEALSEQLEKDGRDPDRLRQCYEAILQLDPSRHDLANKVEELDLHLAQSAGSRKVLPFVGGGVLVLLLVMGFVIRVAVMGQGNGSDAKNEEAVVDLLNAMTRANKDADAFVIGGELEKASGKLQEWHKLACQIWTDHATSQEFSKVELPVLVTTSPPGFTVFVRYGGNEYYQGKTSLRQPHLICRYRPVVSDEGEATVTVLVYDSEEAQKAGMNPRHELEIPAAAYTAPLRVPIYDKPQQMIIVDGWTEGGGVLSAKLKSLFFPSREGKLRVLELEGGRLGPLAGWDAKLKLGEPGDPLSPATLHAGNLLVGVVEREGKSGVVHTKLVAGEAAGALTLRYVTRDPVRAAPLVLQDSSPVVVVATVGGAVHGFALGGNQEWLVNLEGAVRLPLLTLPGDTSRVLVLSEDGHARALTAAGKVDWSWASVSPFVAAPIYLDGDVLLSLADGRIVAVSADDGKLQREVYKDPQGLAPAIIASPDEVLYLATRGGEVLAMRGKTLDWKVDLRRKGRLVPKLAVDRDRIYIAFDGPELLAIERKEGRVVWLGTFPQQGRVTSPIQVLKEGVLVSTSKNLIYLFPTRGKE